MSFDFNLGTGLSGAASGAAIGTQFGGPGIGTAIGAGAGFLSGFLGGDDSPGPREKAIERSRERLKALTEKSPTETTTFNVGATELQERADEEAERDASQAAARGLEGSQFAVAQDANRARQYGEGLRSLLRTSDARLRESRRNTRSQLNALLSGQAQAERQQQAQQNAALQQAFQNIPAVLDAFDTGTDTLGAGAGAGTEVGTGASGRYPGSTGIPSFN
jgi:uncharacterized membrane protein YccC